MTEELLLLVVVLVMVVVSATCVTENMQITTIFRRRASPKAEFESRVRKSAIAVSKMDGKSSKSCKKK